MHKCNIKSFGKFICTCVAVAAMSNTAYGATIDTGCSDESKTYINPELALCSVHIYNVGGTKNPSDAASKQMMKDVVALKTTLITQQIKKQYDFLDTTMRRLQTQLERAVLTTRLQAAGASKDDDSSGSGGGGSSGSSMVPSATALNGAQNCGSIIDLDEVFECLAKNYSLISSVTNDGRTPTGEARKQLATDCKIANSAKSYSSTQTTTSADGKTTTTTTGADDLTRVSISGRTVNCTTTAQLNQSGNFKGCLDALVNVIRRQNTHMSNQKNQYPAYRQY